jgi:hypothetical protein
VLAAGPGVISRSLVDAAARHLGLDRAAVLDSTDPLLPFDRLALSYQLDASGLRLRGECPPSGSGAVLVGRYDLLLREPMVQPVPIAALLHALVPGAEVQVPATSQTDWLLRRLPVPQAPAPRVAEAPSPRPR